MSYRLGLVAGAAVLALGMGVAQAATVTFSDIDALWLNVVGGSGGSTVNPAGPATSTSVRWPASGDQSGYDFIVAPQPITVDLPPDPSPFVLGEFNHLNFPVTTGSGITSVQLQIRADLSIDEGSGPVDLGQTVLLFDFGHLETPNGSNPCADGGAHGVGVNVNGCADRVTFASNPNSESFLIGNTLYTMNLMGFIDSSDNLVSEFWTIESSNNIATLIGNVERAPTATPTPLPTDTFTPEPTNTPTPLPTDTFTPLPTDTFTPEPTATFTATPSFTQEPTETPTATATFTATATDTPILPTCGDGNLDPGEFCDDGNEFGGDGCEPNCTLSTACTYVHGGTPSQYFVNDTTANDGVGAAAGCATAPFASIQAAIDDSALVDGDIISVCPGTYAENVIVSKELTIIANGAAADTLVQTAAGVAFDVRRSGVTIEGLSIELGNGTAVSANAICPLGSASCAAPGSGSNLSIIGNRISGSSTGIAWQRKVDCATIQSNVSDVSNAHVDIDQQEGAPAVLVRIVQNTLSGGGSSGAGVSTSGIGVRILGNTVQGSATAGVVVANLTAGSRIEENNIQNNAGDGITMLPGSAATRVIQNNIVDNGTGLGNEASEGVVNATLNWWGSQSGPFHANKAMAAVGDTIVERNGGLDTLFIEFLCAPAPGGFPSVLGVCNGGELTEEVQMVAPGREPDITPKGRFISFVSHHDLNSDAGVNIDNADGGDEIFVLNVRPRKRGHAFCLGGINPGAPCSLSRDCPANFNSDPIVTDGVCVVITQLSNDPTGDAISFSPRLIQKGDVVFSSTANLLGSNPDNSPEVYTWSNRDFRRLDPGDPNLVVTMRSDGVGTISERAQNDRGGRRVLVQSNTDPLGTNADGNSEIFLLDSRKGQWTQITDTVGHENLRPITQNGKKLIFDSTADLVPGQNADGNREVFFARNRRGTWLFEQITDTVGAENHAASMAKNGRVIVYSSNANPTGQNADGNREVFLWDKNGTVQITHTTVGENVRPRINPFGRFIAFESNSDVDDTGSDLGNRRIFLHDRRFGTTVPISRSAFGENTNPRISRGRFVVWQSTANLTGSNTTGDSVIYLYNRRKDN